MLPLPSRFAFLCLRRGVSVVVNVSSDGTGLFSAYAEVFPRCIRFIKSSSPFLCLRRGVSLPQTWSLQFSGFSLPTQRCFSLLGTPQGGVMLFSAYAEVFPGKYKNHFITGPFLCLRRGVSARCFLRDLHKDFSLPTQRCFPEALEARDVPVLFSAYAEVFRRLRHAAPRRVAFLCLRRGVSTPFHQPLSQCGFSLPTQRCFCIG